MQQDETVDDAIRATQARALVGLVLVLFLAARAPTIIHSSASQDEQWYGIPGLTVAVEGIPRVPYCRARDEGSVFQGAEKILFAQPPLSFYAQAPFFAVLPDGYAAARVSSLLAACLAIVLAYAIGQQVFGDARISLTAAGLYSLSRLLFFPAMSARPDMLCGTLGLTAVYFMTLTKWDDRRAAAASGIAVGLAGLTHPMAIVFALQIGVWNFCRSGSWPRKCARCTLFVLATLATFALWIPLILKSAELFQAQFVGNILRPAGPGLLSRIVMPGESFANQIPQLVERAHPIQFSILGCGLVLCGLLALGRRDRRAGLCWILATSSIYLLVACVGIHPIQGFWCYPAALTWLCVAHALFGMMDFSAIAGAIRVMLSAALFALLLPGAGVRTTWTYVTHWGAKEYSSRRFVREILSEIPNDRSLTVGREFALDAYGYRRDIILACNHPMYFDSAEFPTELLIVGRRDHDAGIIESYKSTGLQLRRMKTFGDVSDSLGCYAELWSIRLD